MRVWVTGCFLLAIFSGCSTPGNVCADLPTGRAVVEAISGRDANVRLQDGEPAVLHLSSAVYVSEGGTCTMTGPQGVRVGDTLAFEVDAWAESYPVQGWPERAVVLR